jgi:hypothetical protein
MSPIYCANCGQANVADAQFCSKCGRGISAVGSVPAQVSGKRIAKALLWILGVPAALVAVVIAWAVFGHADASTAATAVEGEARATAEKSEVQVRDPSLLQRGLGERCMTDCACESRECKAFKCVPRDYVKHPLLGAGHACVHNGDCSGCQCQLGTCN